MKKLAILGASATLAALPVMGVFAAVDPVSQTDTITITVNDSCELAVTNSDAQSLTASMKIGAVKTDFAGSNFKVACNTGTGWELAAVGSSDGGTLNALKATGEGTAIVSTDPATNLAQTDGSAQTSDWGFKFTKGGQTALEEGFDDWKAVPATSQKVASGSALDGTDSVSVTYGVAIGSSQEADTYTGKVTYTLSQPASD